MPTAKDNEVRFKLEGTEYRLLDLDDLEWGEIGLIEDLCDQPINDINFERQTATRALVLVSIRRQDPDTTITFGDLGALTIDKHPLGSKTERKAPADRKRPTKPRAKAKPKAG